MAGWLCRSKALNLATCTKYLVGRSLVTSTTINDKQEGGFLQSLWDNAGFSVPSDAHSKTLTDDNSTYEIICKYFHFILVFFLKELPFFSI